jgi:hypothetical protein
VCHGLRFAAFGRLPNVTALEGAPGGAFSQNETGDCLTVDQQGPREAHDDNSGVKPSAVLQVIAATQPVDVINYCLGGTVGWFVSRVLADPRDVKVRVVVGPARVAAGGKLDLRVRDDVFDCGGELRVRRRPTCRNVYVRWLSRCVNCKRAMARPQSLT